MRIVWLALVTADPKWVAPAYQKTQPVTIYANPTAEDEPEEPEGKRRK